MILRNTFAGTASISSGLQIQFYLVLTGADYNKNEKIGTETEKSNQLLVVTSKENYTMYRLK